ncbi:hypothetical protein BSU04_03845 [Caballeronia sordidicola]|uniref:Uncharacterized protein n=1 Tax=Caballeronia sordidicola TaxID=196367 RepID=A0A226XAF8_CABSO|nr:hypothetical protein BSU04_03845 [Caballeronia sordidicola]
MFQVRFLKFDPVGLLSSSIGTRNKRMCPDGAPSGAPFRFKPAE